MIDWTKIYKQNKGLWVALTKDESTVVSSGKTLKATMSRVGVKEQRNVILLRVHKEVTPYVGVNYEI